MKDWKDYYNEVVNLWMEIMPEGMLSFYGHDITIEELDLWDGNDLKKIIKCLKKLKKEGQ